MRQLERADDLAVLVFWFLGDHWFGRHMNPDEEPVALRTAAFASRRRHPTAAATRWYCWPTIWLTLF
jgi:hypothetical protein